MYIKKAVIVNFRNFRNATFYFTEGVNTLIGENGSGKTNLFRAIRLLLDDTIPPFRRNMSENDFNTSLTDWKGHWIIIHLEFLELSKNESIQCLANHALGNESDVGTYTLIFRPREVKRKELFEASNELDDDTRKNTLKTILENISIDEDYQCSFHCRGQANFADKNTYEDLVGNFETYRFPDPSKEDINLLGVTGKYYNIYEDVSLTFIKALRNVEEELRNPKTSPLILLLKKQNQQIDHKDKSDITNQIKKLNDNISNLENLKELSSNIEDQMTRFIGRTYMPKLEIQSNLSDDILQLYRSLILKVSETESDIFNGTTNQLSLGGANLIYITLKLLSYELDLPKKKAAYFLLIEEPESHLHTHVQKTLFKNIKGNKTQIIYSTHSTQISEVSKLDSINILAKKENYCTVYQPYHNIDSIERCHLERYLDATRSNLLFAKNVILVEGDAELFLFPEMIQKVFGVSLDELGISIINVGSTGFKNIANVFHQDRLQRFCAIVTDNDLSIKTLPEAEPLEKDPLKKYWDKEQSGKNRKSELDNYCNGNNYLKACYATYTFEIDFIIINKNKSYITNGLLPLMYKRNLNGEKNSAEISSCDKINSNEIDICGEEILRIIENREVKDFGKGKGWFALALADCIDHNVEIPEYLLQAFAFAGKECLKSETLKQIAKYRIDKLELNNIDEKSKTLLDEYKANRADDIFCKLLILIGQ